MTGGRQTVGMRAPSHPLTHELLMRFGGGLAAPSANRFGRVSPTTAQHVIDDIGHLLVAGRDAVLDGGPSEVGVESTIVDLTVDPPQVLRAGAITSDDIAQMLDTPLAGASGSRRASGMLESHYAPTCRVVLAADRGEAEDLARGAGDLRIDVLDRAHHPAQMAQRPLRRSPPRRCEWGRRARRRAPRSRRVGTRDPRSAHQGGGRRGPSSAQSS